MEYLKLFDDMTQYESYLYGENMVTPSVCFLTQENIVKYDPIDSQPIVLAVGEQIFRTDVADKSWEIWNDIMRDFSDWHLSDLSIVLNTDGIQLRHHGYNIIEEWVDISHYEWGSWLNRIVLYNPYAPGYGGNAYTKLTDVTLNWNGGIGFNGDTINDNGDIINREVVLVYMDKESSNYGITYWPG